MTTTWMIGEYMSLAPIGWQNFIQDLKDKSIIFDDDGKDRIETLNRELKQYHARFYRSPHNCYLEFTDKKCYTVFVVKYGGNA